MSFRECSPPSEDELAICVPTLGMHGYEATIEQEAGFWHNDLDLPETRDNTGRTTLAYYFGKTLFNSLQEWQILQHPAFDLLPETRREIPRRTALGTLALSRLFRLGWKPHTIRGVAPPGLATIHIDADFISTESTDTPENHRLHVLPQASGHILRHHSPTIANDQWFRKDDLFVRRVVPAQASDEFLIANDIDNVPFDSAKFVTLYPYLPGRHAE